MFGSVVIYLLIAVITIAWYLIKKQLSHWKDRKIPNVEPSFPFGNMKGVGKTIYLHEFFQKVYMEWRHKAPFVGIHFLLQPVLVALDLNLIKQILVKDFNNFVDRGEYYNERDDPISAHLFSLDGQKWRNLRNKLTPTFTSGKMKFMFPTIMGVSDRFGEVFSEIAETNPEVEIKELLARFTTDVIGTCAFGIECNSLKDPNAEFRVMGKRVFTKLRYSLLGMLLIRAFPNFSRMMRLKFNEDIIIDFFMKTVRETVDYREKNDIHRNDFLDMLIKLKNDPNEGQDALTIEKIAAQAFIFFLAGFETSSTTMGFCLYELARNPDIQDKLRKEIIQVMDENNGELTYDCLAKLTYTDQVINETLRRYPPLVVLNRVCKEEYKFEDYEHVIPKGSFVFIPAHAIQHDPDIYPDPETFNPDRFSPEEVKKRSSVSWLAFGDGPRNCIGLRFGRMQAKIGLVTLLKKFRFSVCDKTPIPIQYDFDNPLLGSKGGIILKVDNI